MTIAVGFRCTDGILLASDTLYSGTVQNDNGPKFWVLRDDDPLVVFGGAGTVGALTRARDEIQRALRKGSSFQRTLDAIDHVLEKIHKKFPPKTEAPHVQALVVIRAEDRNALYQNIYGETSLSPVDLPTTCLGVDTLGNYFTALLYRSEMPIKWARVVAAYLVKNCKTYASGYCGGETHLIEVPNTGSPVRTTDRKTIEALEAHLGQFDDAMHALLPGTDPNASDISIGHRWTVLKTAIEKARGLAVATISPYSGAMALTGYPTTVSITETPLPLKIASQGEE